MEKVQGLRVQLEAESEDKRKLSSRVDQLTKDLASSVSGPGTNGPSSVHVSSVSDVYHSTIKVHKLSQSKVLLQQESGSTQLLKDNLQQLENVVRDANKKVAVYEGKCEQLTAIVAEHQLFTKVTWLRVPAT